MTATKTGLRQGVFTTRFMAFADSLALGRRQHHHVEKAIHDAFLHIENHHATDGDGTSLACKMTNQSLPVEPGVVVALLCASLRSAIVSNKQGKTIDETELAEMVRAPFADDLAAHERFLDENMELASALAT